MTLPIELFNEIVDRMPARDLFKLGEASREMNDMIDATVQRRFTRVVQSTAYRVYFEGTRACDTRQSHPQPLEFSHFESPTQAILVPHSDAPAPVPQFLPLEEDEFLATYNFSLSLEGCGQPYLKADPHAVSPREDEIVLDEDQDTAGVPVVVPPLPAALRNYSPAVGRPPTSFSTPTSSQVMFQLPLAKGFDRMSRSWFERSATVGSIIRDSPYPSPPPSRSASPPPGLEGELGGMRITSPPPKSRVTSTQTLRPSRGSCLLAVTIDCVDATELPPTPPSSYPRPAGPSLFEYQFMHIAVDVRRFLVEVEEGFQSHSSSTQVMIRL